MSQHASERTLAPVHHVILCHPDLNSFNAAVAHTYCAMVESAGQRTHLRDLYRMKFDPVLKRDERPRSPAFHLHDDVAAELALVREADVIVLVYPIWFGTPPAMLKGYVDRVFGANFHYEDVRDRSGTSPLRGKHLLSITTSGNSMQWLESQGAWLSLLYVFDSYLKNAFSLMSRDHLHLGNITDTLKKRHVDEELLRVAAKARETAAHVLQGHGHHDHDMMA